jgi:hypothetical protein
LLSRKKAQCTGHFFRIWPDATISIARITDSDTTSGGNGVHLETETMQIVVD